MTTNSNLYYIGTSMSNNTVTIEDEALTIDQLLDWSDAIAKRLGYLDREIAKLEQERAHWDARLQVVQDGIAKLENEVAK